MIDMNDFRYFMTVVDHGSFTAAGHALGLPTSTLSYRIKHLEVKLGLSLLTRTSRRLSLTEAGAEFYRHAQLTVEHADEAMRAMRARVAEPFGSIRYTTALATAQFVMPDVLRSFVARYPGISLFEHASDHIVDLVAERFDLAIRSHTGPLPDSAFIQRPLAKLPWQLYASPAYLEENGEPSTLTDLEKHAILFVRRTNAPPRWRFSSTASRETQELSISPRLSSTSVVSIRKWTKAGVGIASLPSYLCRHDLDNEELKVVLPNWITADTSLTALIPNRTGMIAGLREFLDHVADTCRGVISASSST
jgi:DNA-binding transcriptional LysR family regulator